MYILWFLLVSCLGLSVYGRERGGPTEIVVGLAGFIIVGTVILIGTAEKLGIH